VHKAALNEAAAAGLLLLADWQEAAGRPGEDCQALEAFLQDHYTVVVGQGFLCCGLW